MTIKKLKEIITNLPDSMEVFVAERKTDFAYGLITGAYVKNINFMEEPDGEILCEDTVLVLDEDIIPHIQPINKI
jgi:hypothetical protein